MEREKWESRSSPASVNCKVVTGVIAMGHPPPFQHQVLGGETKRAALAFGSANAAGAFVQGVAARPFYQQAHTDGLLPPRFWSFKIHFQQNEGLKKDKQALLSECFLHLLFPPECECWRSWLQCRFQRTLEMEEANLPLFLD